MLTEAILDIHLRGAESFEFGLRLEIVYVEETFHLKLSKFVDCLVVVTCLQRFEANVRGKSCTKIKHFLAYL